MGLTPIKSVRLFSVTFLFLLADSPSVVFLERLQSFPNLPSHLISYLGSLYKLSSTPNAEIRYRFYDIALAEPSSAAAKGFAGEAANWLVGTDGTGVIKGRMKFCRPVFRAINQVNNNLAVTTFKKNQDAFHPIARKLIARVCVFIND